MRDMLQNRQAPDAFGSIAKEAIYYGADSAFAPQYKRFARNRYRDDFAWLLANRGLSIRPMIEIASYIVHCVNQQLTALFHQYSDGPDGPASQYISGALLVAKHALIKQFGEKGESFLDLFSIPITHSNTSFITPFVYNEVNSKPLLDLGQHVYVSSQYRLFESIYESPYYWMLADPHYRDIASANRGRFLEQEIARMMRSVFGRDHVFTNVVIKTRKHQIAAEADVLVAYGEFLLVVQAKSKRLTLAAKAGDLSKINDDFQAAIQSAYDQAIKFIDLALTGAECEIGPSSRRVFKSLVRAFPIVVLSDHFPSLTFLTNKLVKEDRERSPVVIDLFFLNILLEILNNPVDALYYLQQRARFFSKLLTDSEYNLLGFHVKQKLYVNDEWQMMLIDRDFAQDIDSYFTAKETGQDPPIEFVAMEDRMDIPAATALISALKSGPPEVAGAAIDLGFLRGCA